MRQTIFKDFELFSGTPANPTYHIHFAVRNGTDSHPSMADNSGGENAKKGEVDHVGWGSQSWINLGIACLVVSRTNTKIQ